MSADDDMRLYHQGAGNAADSMLGTLVHAIDMVEIKDGISPEGKRRIVTDATFVALCQQPELCEVDPEELHAFVLAEYDRTGVTR